MPGYVDGFLLVVPKKNMRAYRQMAATAGKIWRKYGALDYKECVGDDLKPKGIVFTFPKAVNLKPSETVVFSYIVYKSRAHRDRVNAKVMKDPLMNDPKYTDKTMPFDMKRMAFGGFKVIVDA
ncbi:MAG: DUF1428 domain-containing protein [Candidatus Andersenbacteria bacterium]